MGYQGLNQISCLQDKCPGHCSTVLSKPLVPENIYDAKELRRGAMTVERWGGEEAANSEYGVGALLLIVAILEVENVEMLLEIEVIEVVEVEVMTEMVKVLEGGGGDGSRRNWRDDAVMKL